MKECHALGSQIKRTAVKHMRARSGRTIQGKVSNVRRDGGIAGGAVADVRTVDVDTGCQATGKHSKFKTPQPASSTTGPAMQTGKDD